MQVVALLVWPVCRDLCLCYHSEGSLSVCHFDKAPNFIAKSLSLGDLLALHCWSHIWHLLTWTHTHSFIQVCVCVCFEAGKSVFTVYTSPLSIYPCTCGADQRAGCHNLYPLHHLMSCQCDSSENLRQQAVITLYNVWPALVQVIFVWTGRGNCVMLLTSISFSCPFY